MVVSDRPASPLERSCYSDAVRRPLDRDRLTTFLRALGGAAKGPGTVYLTGGATAVLHGWRSSTIDVDIKLEPEPAGVFESIARLKNELDINVELASPDLFIPVPEDWKEHSDYIGAFGRIEVLHFDYRAQALAKIARGHERDIRDVDAMIANHLVDAPSLRSTFDLVQPRLVRYPGLDAERFAERLVAYVDAH